MSWRTCVVVKQIQSNPIKVEEAMTSAEINAELVWPHQEHMIMIPRDTTSLKE